VVTAVSESDRSVSRPRRRRLAIAWRLVSSTLAKSWNDRVLGLAAEAGFWQLLSLPSFLLAVLGVVGYFSGALGPDTVHSIENAIVRGLRHVIVPSAVDSTVRPALHRILVSGRADVVSISFIVIVLT
jgi:membrane protein